MTVRAMRRIDIVASPLEWLRSGYIRRGDNIGGFPRTTSANANPDGTVMWPGTRVPPIGATNGGATSRETANRPTNRSATNRRRSSGSVGCERERAATSPLSSRVSHSAPLLLVSPLLVLRCVASPRGPVRCIY